MSTTRLLTAKEHVRQVLRKLGLQRANMVLWPDERHQLRATIVSLRAAGPGGLVAILVTVPAMTNAAFRALETLSDEGELDVVVSGADVREGRLTYSSLRETELDEMIAPEPANQQEMVASELEHQREMAALEFEYQRELTALELEYQLEVATLEREHQREMAKFEAFAPTSALPVPARPRSSPLLEAPPSSITRQTLASPPSRLPWADTALTGSGSLPSSISSIGSTASAKRAGSSIAHGPATCSSDHTADNLSWPSSQFDPTSAPRQDEPLSEGETPPKRWHPEEDGATLRLTPEGRQRALSRQLEVRGAQTTRQLMSALGWKRGTTRQVIEALLLQQQIRTQASSLSSPFQRYELMRSQTELIDHR